MVVLVLWGCTPPERDYHPRAPGPDTDTPGATADTAPRHTGDTANATGDTGPVVIDCTGLPDVGTFVREHDYVPGFEDFTFDSLGNLWGVSDGRLMRIAYDGPAEVLRDGVASIARGTRLLDDGTLLSVDYTNNALIRIDTASYAVSVVTGALSSPNAIAIGQEGFIYLTQGNGRVQRIDPVSGAATVFVDSPVSNDGITFSPDYSKLYLNSDLDGSFMSVGVSVDGVLTDPLVNVTTLPGPSDGMTMDACGNAYVVQISSQNIERVNVDGTHQLFVDLPANGLLAVAANFGSGVGGWERDHLYIAGFGETMYEVDAGVVGKWEPQYP